MNRPSPIGALIICAALMAGAPALAERACVAVPDGQVVCNTLPARSDLVRPASANFISGPERKAGAGGLAHQIGNCWNVGALSAEAMRIAVTVEFEMTPDGIPVPESVRMIGNSGGSDTAIAQAYEAARRAVLRCGATGYDLPIESYDHWHRIEITFDPDEMRP